MWDKVFSTASWILVLVLVFATVSLWTIFPPVSTAGPVVNAAGIIGAKIFYSALYASQAILLAYSKFMKKKNMRKTVLMFIYLTGAFTTILSLVIGGFNYRLIDNLVATIIAAGCWLYWKFKTEYISYADFESDIDQLRNDSPPFRKS